MPSMFSSRPTGQESRHATLPIPHRPSVHESSQQREGLRTLLSSLDTEGVDPRLSDLDVAPTLEIVKIMNDADRLVPAAIELIQDNIAEVIDEVVARMKQGGRLIYSGAGTAGRLGILDASEAPPTFGTPPGLLVGLIAGGQRAIHTAVENAEDDAEAGADDLRALGITRLDSVIGISASGRTPYAVGSVEYARSVGAFTAGLSCNRASDLGRAADVPLEVVVGPEVIAGSTRLKAGTAQKLVLNIISSAVMIRLGKTYGNLMVDLQATNEKLRARSERTIMLASHCDAHTAAETLQAVGGSVKAAILVLKGGIEPDEVATVLKNHDGYLRAALQDGKVRDRTDG